MIRAPPKITLGPQRRHCISAPSAARRSSLRAQELSCAPGVEREISSSSSFMSADTSANSGVLR